MSMSSPTAPTTHAPHQRLILYALGQSDAELVAHMAMCDTCRSQAEAYRSVLTATRDVLNPAAGRVNLVSCEGQCILEGAECQLSGTHHLLRVAMRTANGELHGHLSVSDGCTCWHGTPVRLFGSHGLVASSHVDAQGDFQFPMPAHGQRYSLGLVLTRQGEPELQIIGNFELR